MSVNLYKKSFIISLCLNATSFISAYDFNTYERAEFYNNQSFREWVDASEALKEYPFQGNESILEIGCRDGRISANLAGRIPNGDIISIDIRGSGAIQFANLNHSKELYPNLTFLEKDVLDLDDENCFDLAVSFYSLHWNPDQLVTLQKIYQLLKKNGTLLFNIPLKMSPEAAAIFREVFNREEWKVYFCNYSHPRQKLNGDEYASLLTSVGFKSLDIRMQKREYLFENKRAFINFFKLHSFIDRLPEEKIDKFLTDLVNQYAQHFIRSDGQIPFIFEELLVKAIKLN